MRTSYFGRNCGICTHELTHGFFSLSKRCQTLAVTPSSSVVLVADDELLTDFCSQECANYAEAAISSTLTAPYPGASATVPCSLCLRAVNRSKPHVAVSLTDFEDASEPWLVSARVVDERELAVYCHSCAEPRRASKAFDEAELGVGA
jgi:hypothetical protein